MKTPHILAESKLSRIHLGPQKQALQRHESLEGGERSLQIKNIVFSKEIPPDRSKNDASLVL